MKSFYLTDAGKVRDHNEDSVIIVKNNDGAYLMAIADGMGGHSAGEVASSIAIGYLGKHFKETKKGAYIEFAKLVLDEYVDKKLLEWKISERDKFHLICELIDVFKKYDSE